MHFCSGLPIILVACKKDLRKDPRTIEELRKTSQRPVSPEEVRVPRSLPAIPCTTSPRSTSFNFVHKLPLTYHRSRVIGHGHRAKDRGEALPRMLSPDRRRCRSGLPVRHPSGALESEQDQEQEVHRRMSGVR